MDWYLVRITDENNFIWRLGRGYNKHGKQVMKGKLHINASRQSVDPTRECTHRNEMSCNLGVWESGTSLPCIPLALVRFFHVLYARVYAWCLYDRLLFVARSGDIIYCDSSTKCSNGSFAFIRCFLRTTCCIPWCIQMSFAHLSSLSVACFGPQPPHQ